MTVSQETSIARLLERCKISVKPPACALCADAPHREEQQPIKERYWEVVGALMWRANISGPDIVNVLRVVTRHAHDATWKD